MRKERFVCIEWDDATYNAGYYDIDDKKRFEPVRCKTIGHLIKSTRKEILVAMDRFGDDDDDLRHISTIPKSIVRKIRYLEDRTMVAE